MSLKAWASKKRLVSRQNLSLRRSRAHSRRHVVAQFRQVLQARGRAITFTFFPVIANTADMFLAFQASNIEIDGCAMGEMHVSLPETEQFLQADLSRDPNDDLKSAEQDHSS